jgi:hypothetical protein
MVITKEKVSSDIINLNDVQLRQVAEFLDYLKFKEKNNPQRQFDESEIAKLYREFGEEDRELAESGSADYAENLNLEDAKK